MSVSIKISGKKSVLPATAGNWTFAHRPGGWIIAERTAADGTHERKRFLMSESRGRVSAQIHGWPWHGEIVSEARGGGAAGSDADLIANFPGKVRKLMVAAGAQVKEGEPLLMVEAMKMEFPVKAPFDGTVTKLLVTEGQQLSPGDRFLDFEPAKAEE